MSVLKHLKTLQHVSIFSDHLQGACRFLVKVTVLCGGMLEAYLSTQSTTHTHHTLRCHTTTNNFYDFKNFKFSDFNKDPTSSLKII